MTDHEDTREVAKSLGYIIGKLDSMERAQTRTTFALVGVIAAQVGVKVLGTPILLDIATALALFGTALLLGCLLAGIRLIKKQGQKVTKTGRWLTAVVFCIIITQVSVYFRDLGYLNANIIYGIRIVQNIVIILFAWNLMQNARIFANNNNCGKDGEKKID